MKTLKSAAIVLGLFSLLAGTTTLVRAQDYQDNYQDDGYSTGNVSMQTFYDELSPYGTWIQDPQYGYVWRPDVDQNEFRPYYTNGRWAMTEYGNTWVSNYNWGWAPFHYGRWVINSYRQWIWMPDTNWGPAWVDWRSGDGYYGWAPMAPSININLSFGRRYSVPEFCWNFIPQRNIYINTFPRYDYGRNNVYIRNTTIINNTYVYNKRNYYGGPRIDDIRRATNRDVTVYRYAQSNRPGASRIGGREVSIYRPRPERNAVDNRSAAPRKFEQGNAGFNRGGRDNNNANRPNGNSNDTRFGQRNDNRGAQPSRGSDAGVGTNNNNLPNNRGDVYNRNAAGRAERGNANSVGQKNGQTNVGDRSQDQQRAQQTQQQRTGRGQQDRMSQDQQRVQRDVQSNQQQRDAQVQQRSQQADQQRGQQAQQQQQQRSAQVEQQRAQRDAQVQQQRSQQADQQRAQQAQQQQQQRSAQVEQQRAQRDAQVQQQRSQQADQQRAQQAQQQQQRTAQAEQQRAQRDAQAQQQRSQQAEQQRAQQQQRSEQRRVEAPQRQQQQRSGSEGGRPSRGGRG